MKTLPQNQDLVAICSRVKLIPVLVIDDVDSAIPLAQALIRGGLNVLEVTLRTASALDAIREMAKLEGAIVGAGTILTADDMRLVQEAGGVFGVTPGTTQTLLDAAKATGLGLIPGVATVSEVMMAREQGYHFLKFFPAQSSGGVKALSSFSGPLADIQFCPTGGITSDNAAAFIKLKNVICVGGSWVAPKELVNNKQWDKIEALATQAKDVLARS